MRIAVEQMQKNNFPDKADLTGLGDIGVFKTVLPPWPQGEGPAP